MTDELGDIMLERDFELSDSKGNSGAVKLRIGKPYRVSEEKWHCPYQIIGITSETVKTAPGRDAIDAMLTSLQLAEIFLKSYRDVKITWQGDEELCLHLSPVKGIREPDKSDLLDPNSPFKKVFDEFFRNIDKKSSEPPANPEAQS